jgi:hypothetical protein
MTNETDDFKIRQLTQIGFGILDFRKSEISLNSLLSVIGGASQAIGENFWEQEVFCTYLALEQINIDLIEEQRILTSSEELQVEKIIFEFEKILTNYKDNLFK